MDIQSFEVPADGILVDLACSPIRLARSVQTQKAHGSCMHQARRVVKCSSCMLSGRTHIIHWLLFPLPSYLNVLHGRFALDRIVVVGEYDNLDLWYAQPHPWYFADFPP